MSINTVCTHTFMQSRSSSVIKAITILVLMNTLKLYSITGDKLAQIKLNIATPDPD